MNLLLIFVLTGLLLSVGSSQCVETNDNGYYVAVRDRCNPRTWQDAEDFCTDEVNSHLATILNAQYNRYAYQARNGLPGGFNEDAWIGATDQASEGNFVWTEGHEDFDFDNWFASEPNNYGVNQDCAIMGQRSDRWDDQNCNLQYDTWICNSLALQTCQVEDNIAVWAPLGSFTFDQAQSYCEANYNNGRLISIGSEDTQNEAEAARDCVPGIPDDRYCWIGLESNNGNLEWTDGSSLNYLNFVGNADTSAGDCVVMLPVDSWDYFNCNSEFIACFICEQGSDGGGGDPTPRPTSNPTDRPTPMPVDSPAGNPGIWWQSWWNRP